MSKSDYKKTLNLPQTDFPMRANLAQREPEQLAEWDSSKLYQKICRKNSGRPPFTLHDGPPYANGSIHHGHILNKVLKDIVIKYKSMKGYLAPYVPGWDCHGLPIEHEVDKQLGAKKKTLSVTAIRKACRAHAEKFINIQREEFKRLGVLGDWERPYFTMDYAYEAAIAREFGKAVEKGSIYQGEKPVLWCPSCQTALAEAEIEYEKHGSPSLYVKFPMAEDLGDSIPQLKGRKASVVIWTTTPWTIPSNLAVAFHPNYDYIAVETDSDIYIIANALEDEFKKILEKDFKVLARFSAKLLERKKAHHPFLNRDSLLVLADHVTMDSGTGCVHIAPGHGQEDFIVGKKYGLKILTPVDKDGRLTEEAEVPELTGTSVFKANAPLIEKMRANGSLLKAVDFEHSYPHCWRCKNPVIFRATKQWFLSLEKNDLRNRALDAVRRVEWIPPWGRERIYGMVENRPDWCLSRQRLWGVPIIAFRCTACEAHLLDKKLIDHIADLFEKEGADIWFEKTVEELTGKDLKCPQCGQGRLEKERDILDVWFDSGVSFTVVENHKDLSFPADLYLEGSDQHRGWFHSSLLTAIETRGQAPYKAALTHGFVVDGEGKKYSKSAKNYVPADTVIKKDGAEILRLWAAAEDYRNDIRISDEILNRLVEAYRKIRNTCRFLLGNLHDFTPSEDTLKVASLEEIHQWILHHLQKMVLRVDQAYKNYEFHIIFHELNKFCTVSLSSIYLDILKDCFYCEATNSPRRKEAQIVIFEILKTLTRLMAPILSFTAEEVWKFVPSFQGKEESIHLESFPAIHLEWMNDALAHQWDQLLQVREEVAKQLESSRQAKEIGNSLEAKVLIAADGSLKELLKQYYMQLGEFFLVSQVKMSSDQIHKDYQSEKIPSLFIKTEKAEGAKCERCWNYRLTVGKNPQHLALCERCVKVIGEEKKFNAAQI